jgi:hypothetical protein
MTESNEEIGRAYDWPDGDKLELFANREQLLIKAHDSGIIPVGDLISDSGKLVAAFSLAQEGHLLLDTQTPGLMRLSAQGRLFALGASALRHGDD